MSKMKSEKSSGNRIFAGIIGLILAFSLISGSVAVAENKAAVAEVKKAGFKLSTDMLSALEFMANLDDFYFKVQAGEKLPKNIMDLLKKYDPDQLYQLIHNEIDKIRSEEQSKVVSHKRTEYNYIFPGVYFITNETERKFIEEIQALNIEAVREMSKKKALEIAEKIIDYFDYVPHTRQKGEYGFRFMLYYVYCETRYYAYYFDWTKNPEFRETIDMAQQPCGFSPSARETVNKIKSDLGIIKDYELPIKAIYPATREQLDAQAEEKTDQER